MPGTCLPKTVWTGLGSLLTGPSERETCERSAPGLLNSVAEDRQQVSTALQQVATGRRVNSLSDDPLAAAALVQNATEASSLDQFTRSISSVQGSLQTGDSALNSVVNSLTQAISLGTEGANGTMTPDNRKTLATQVDSLQQEILGLANTTYQGEYIFAGTAVNTQPFVADGSAPSGVIYKGNNSTNAIQVGEAQSVTANKPGSAIFNGAGAHVFQSLHDLSSALQTNGDIAGATAEVQKALNNVDLQRTFYGATQAEFSSLAGSQCIGRFLFLKLDRSHATKRSSKFG